jgi:hypothetical protein
MAQLFDTAKLFRLNVGKWKSITRKGADMPVYVAKFKGSMVQVQKAKEERVSLKRCKEVLNKNGNNYSDQEISEIRDFLYELGRIDYAVFIHNENKEREKERALLLEAENLDPNNPNQNQVA